jgi:hypothetical protein
LTNMQSDYITSVQQQFRYYKMLGDKTIDQLTPEQLYWQYNGTSNSVGIIIQHVSGNMLSRWTDFLTTDGEKDFRKRDEEFEEKKLSHRDLLAQWERGWECLFTALASVNDENFDTVIYIRNQGHSIPEAINRQMMHYAYHVGQMVHIGKMLRDNEWQSLSIPKGKSKAYNQDKFSQEKSRTHFTQEYLSDNDNTL